MTTTPTSDGAILLLGAGRMGSALLHGWLAQGIPADAVTVLDPSPGPELQRLAAQSGLRLNPSEAGRADVLVVAVKPQAVEAVAPGIQAWLAPESLVVSIMAGKTLADLRRLFPAAGSFVRAMPNLPAAVGRGATVAVADPLCPPAHAERAGRLLGAVGALEWLAEEALMDVATAVSGSGPAYVFYLVECLTQVATEAGLPPDVAERLSRATVEGAGELMRATGLPAAELRANVTSPGGTTAAGLSVLTGGGRLHALLAATVLAATRRARELGGAPPA
ncbi:pyrroline-5-carboxylate reductase [Azospirillum sp.]|uniref:pyrroline-5-carboxylate reductase n=1 Tax=Azospirillum sp. TaxID=34012 RepID=UPI002D485D12|nr:pyrroline-5-carboxylate reductase [Azospirillum sp.]HYD67319.1 pyrroline-5-carboxylate reductase [Azospirillum sp.]